MFDDTDKTLTLTWTVATIEIVKGELQASASVWIMQWESNRVHRQENDFSETTEKLHKSTETSPINNNRVIMLQSV